MRFRCECKSWNNYFIKNPIFVAKHLAYALSRNDSARFIVTRFPPPRCRPIALLSNETLEVFADVGFPSSTIDNSHLVISGSCNGILCLQTLTPCRESWHVGQRPGDKIALWNPATREFRTLPLSSVPYPSNALVFRARVGFGFDPNTNDYKVIRILDFKTEQHKHRPQVEVYNLSTDAWRKIDAVLPALLHLISPTFLKGFYFWWAGDENGCWFILSFDMGNDLFEKISPPCVDNLREVTLVNFNESLALVVKRERPNKSFEVWVMNKDDCEKTWTKQLTIGNHPEILQVLGFSKNGKAIMHSTYGRSLLLYDLSTHRWKYQLCNAHIKVNNRVGNYVESLVSIKGGNRLNGEEDGAFTSKPMVPAPIYVNRSRRFHSSYNFRVMKKLKTTSYLD